MNRGITKKQNLKKEFLFLIVVLSLKEETINEPVLKEE